MDSQRKVTPGQAAFNSWYKAMTEGLPPEGAWNSLDADLQEIWKNVAKASIAANTDVDSAMAIQEAYERGCIDGGA